MNPKNYDENGDFCIFPARWAENYDENGDFCIFPLGKAESAMKTAFFAFFAQPYMSDFLSFQPYTLCRATLHNEGFCVGFSDQTLHT